MADMTLGLYWFRLVPLVALLWGLPAEANADISRRVSFIKEVEKLDTVEPQLFLMPVKQPWLGQTAAVKQNDTEQDLLFNVEGTLAEGDTQFDDESLYDVHQFEGEAGQIIRITLTSAEFDAFLLLQSASGEELTRNDDGGKGKNAEIVFRLPNTGPYRLLANAYDASGRGTYQLTVAQADEQALRQAEADRLLQEGLNAFGSSQYQTALEAWQSALEIHVEIGDRWGEAASLSNLGNAYKNLGEYARAIDFYQQSLAIEREIGDRRGEAASLGSLGSVYESLGEYERAIEFHQQSLVIARESGDRSVEAFALGNLGSAYESLGEYERAIEFHQQSLVIARESGDRDWEAASLGNLGSAYESLGEYERAIDFHQQSLVISREIGDRGGGKQPRWAVWAVFTTIWANISARLTSISSI